MDPQIGKLAFTLGIYFLLMALVALPFLPLSSAAFEVDLIAIGVSVLFLGGLIWRIRRETRIMGGKPHSSEQGKQGD